MTDWKAIADALAAALKAMRKTEPDEGPDGTILGYGIYEASEGDPEYELAEDAVAAYEAATGRTMPECVCGHEQNAHFRDDGECMFSTDNEVWACGCSEYRPALIDGQADGS